MYETKIAKSPNASSVAQKGIKVGMQKYLFTSRFPRYESNYIFYNAPCSMQKQLLESIL